VDERTGARVRRLLGRALVLPLLWIAFEGALALLGIAGPEDQPLLPYQQVRVPLYEARGERFQAHEERLGARTFAVEKPADLVRVFCLGGSAVRGLGTSPNASLPAYLERTLTACGPPGKRYEVLNAGVVGISSRQVRAMCADVVARYAPDLVVVCSGNNEFLELHARKYQELQDASPGRALAARIRGLRSFRLLRSLRPRRAAVEPSATTEVRMTATEFIAEVEITPADVEGALAEYQDNLEAIAATCAETGVPLCLLTVPANLRWSDPRPEPDWDERLCAAWQLAPPAGREARLAALRAEAGRRLEAASGAARSELAYLRGKCEEALGDLDAARASYLLAQDSDEHRRRTTTAMNALVTAAARDHGARLVDTVAFLATLEPIPGFRWMYDHIHTTPEGALRLAGRVAEEVVSTLFPDGPPLAGLAEFQATTRAALEARIAAGEDFPESDAWIGFSFDPALLADRDLWKYDRSVAALRAAAEAPDADPAHRGKVLTFLGNALSFELGGRARARACYEEAATLVPAWGAALAGNLARLGE